MANLSFAHFEGHTTSVYLQPKFCGIVCLDDAVDEIVGETNVDIKAVAASEINYAKNLLNFTCSILLDD